MVNSDLCWMKDEQKRDCEFDHGGYFLIKGAEKVSSFPSLMYPLYSYIFFLKKKLGPLYSYIFSVNELHCFLKFYCHQIIISKILMDCLFKEIIIT